jgi:hypothetical protein
MGQCPRPIERSALVSRRTAALKRGLLEAPPPLQRRYVHGLVSEIMVDKKKAVISGPKASLAAAITAGTHDGEVRVFS